MEASDNRGAPLIAHILHALDSVDSGEGTTEPLALVLGLSGGPDSQALVHALASVRDRGAVPLRLLAVGIDHGLRPESAQELACAERLARALGISFETKRVVVGVGNLMEQAREARYRALRHRAAEWRDQLAGTRILIATGHHQRDQAETLLFRLARGSDISGLAPMRILNGDLLRPLLECPKAEIESYVAHHKLEHAEDPSNRAQSFSRAQLRHEVLPILRRINPQAETHLAEAASRWAEDEDWLATRASQRLDSLRRGGYGIDLRGLRFEAPAIGRRAAKAWLREFSEGRLGWVERVLSLDPDGNERFTLAHQDLEVRRGILWRPAPSLEASAGPREGLPWTYPAFGWALCTADTDRGVSPSLDRCPVPVEELTETEIRSVHPGDKIRLGQDGYHRKVSDVFVDLKVPRNLRAGWPIMTHRGRVCWIMGLRASPPPGGSSGPLLLGRLPWET